MIFFVTNLMMTWHFFILDFGTKNDCPLRRWATGERDKSTLEVNLSSDDTDVTDINWKLSARPNRWSWLLK